MKLNFRHGIVRCKIGDQPTYLSLNGNSVDLNTLDTTIILSVSQGNSNYLVEEISSIKNAWGPFNDPMIDFTNGQSVPTGIDYYLYWDINLATGALTRGFTKVKPILTRAQKPSSPITNQHWYDFDSSVMQVWTGHSWVQTLRVFAAIVKNLSTIEYFDVGSQIGINDVNVSSGFILYGADNVAIKDNNNNFITTESNLRLNVGSFTSPIEFETSSTYAIAIEPIPKFSLVYLAAERKIGLASSNDLSKSAIGIVLENAMPGESSRYTNHGIVTNELWNWPQESIGKTIYCGETGELSLSQSNISIQKVGKIIGQHAIFLNIEIDSTAVTVSQEIYDSSSSKKGITFLSVDPIRETYPIAVGDNDPRMTNARLPLQHVHSMTDIANLQIIINDLQQNKIGFTGGTVKAYLNLTYTPTDPNHAVNKQYVDNQSQGLDPKASVRVATTDNIVLFGPQIVDKVTLDIGDRVLVRAQTIRTENGIYNVRANAWTRATDADDSIKMTAGAYFFTEEGEKYSHAGWVSSLPKNFQLNRDVMDFVQFNGAAQIYVTAGLYKNGNEIGINYSSNITSVAGALDLSQTGVMQGTYCRMTVDQYGRVLQGLPISTYDIPEAPTNLYFTTDRAQSALSTGALGNYAFANIPANAVIISDENGKIVSSSISAHELLSLKNITGNIQEQLAGFQLSSDSNLTSEILQRTSADTNLQELIQTETVTRGAEDNLIKNNLSNEILNRTSGDNVLTSSLNTEVTRATAAESTITAALDAEVTRAHSAESTNATAITAEVTRATAAESTIIATLAAEVTRANTAESANATAISTEVTRATSAESTITAALSTEVTRATTAESANAVAIAAEVTRATAAESTNATAITSEVTRARTAESTNATAISAEVARASAAESTIASNLAAEIVNRDAAILASIPTFATLSGAASGVRSVILSGLSTASASAISATDTMLSAFGKLQAQFSSLFGNVIPSSLGNAATGIATTFSRADHIHPLPTYLNNVTNINEAVNIVPTSGANQLLQVMQYGVHDVTLNMPCAFSFSSVPAGYLYSFALILHQDATGGRTATWPATVKWFGGAAPTITAMANKTDLLTFFTSDGGATWYGSIGGQNA